MVKEDLQDPLDKLVNQEEWDQLVKGVILAPLVYLEHLDLEGLLDLKDKEDKMDNQVPLGNLVEWVRLVS